MIVEMNVSVNQGYQFFAGPRDVFEFQTFRFEMAEEVLAARIVVTVGLP